MPSAVMVVAVTNPNLRRLIDITSSLTAWRIELRQEPGALLRHAGRGVGMLRQQPAPQIAGRRLLAVDLDIELAGAESGDLFGVQGDLAGQGAVIGLRHGEI